jgi:hypothetical protein
MVQRVTVFSALDDNATATTALLRFTELTTPILEVSSESTLCTCVVVAEAGR